ncbi:Down syndrome cell adhesion molecule-like protein Dscam2 [Dermacentor silvarum]|uniref:Down syndrome cell adhesion molecule-like protein Dscam2 n=1 Tax=Dermacentor silvarum TaxID=543639 RepID=UPI00189B6560|nr:Down syndrome cell adhesion molecule-like protein Dscam2 [Dermacentor silvarum]
MLVYKGSKENEEEQKKSPVKDSTPATLPMQPMQLRRIQRLESNYCVWTLERALIYGSTSSSLQGGGRGPTIVLEPPTLVEFSSDAGAVLPCSAHGQPPPNIRWEKEDGSSASTVPGLRETRSDGSLVFPAFSGSHFRPEVHTATYRCVASNALGLVKSRLAHVRGVVLEKFVASVYDVYVVRGNSALLRCHVPPAVRDYIKVTSWVLDDGVTIGTLGNDGKY